MNIIYDYFQRQIYVPILSFINVAQPYLHLNERNKTHQ